MRAKDLFEKSTSQAQFRTMAAAANNPKFAKKVGISQDVAREFHAADRKSDYKKLPDHANESQLNELFDADQQYFKLADGQVIRADFTQAGLNPDGMSSSIKISTVDPKIMPSAATTAVQPWDKARPNIRAAIQKWVQGGQQTVSEIKKGQKDSNGYTKCWPGKHAEGTKKSAVTGKQVRNCVPNEGVEEAANPAQQAAIAIAMKKAGQKPKSQGVAEGYQLDEGAIETITALVKKIPGIGKYYQMAQQYKPQLIEILKTSKSSKEVKQKMEQLAAGQSATVTESGMMKQLGGLAVGGGSILSTMWMNAMGMIDGVLAHAAAGEVGGAVASGSILGLIPVTLMLFAAMLMFKGSNQSSDEKAQAFQAQRGQQGVAEDTELAEEFDLIESIVEMIAEHNGVDAEVVWADLESLTEDELYVFAVTSDPLMEDWQKANKRDKTDGMSQKAVNAYRRENPGSKLKTAVTTKPGKLKKGGKASKRRKSYCSRSRGQMKMHSISCAKTPDKAICKARRRWNC